MGYTLLWLESLGAALLFLATITALFARVRWRRVPRFVPILTALAMIGMAAAGTFLVGMFQFTPFIQTTWFAPVLGWSIVFTFGAIALLLRGLRRGAEAVTLARAWPLGRLAVAFATLLVLSCITFANMDAVVKVQLASVRAEAGARILALAPSRVPDSANAAPLYLEAFELLPPLGRTSPVWRENSRGHVSYDAATVDPKSKEFRAFIQAQQPALALLRKGAARPGFWFERDYFQGIEMLLPEARQLQQAGVLLAYDALALAAEGKTRQALDDVVAIFGIAHQFEEPVILSLFTAVGVERTGFLALQDVLRLAPPKSNDLQGISLPASVRFRAVLERGLRMEEATLGLNCFGMLSVQPLPEVVYFLEGGKKRDSLLGSILGSPFYRVFLVADDFASYRRFMYEAEELCKHPYYEAISQVQAMDKNWRATRGGVIAWLVVPALQRTYATVANGEAYHRLSRLGLAATAYRLKYGAFPSSIDSLAPEFLPRVPLDPFDGEPMRMKTDKADLLFYSVGIDRKDDGGLPEDPERFGANSDIVFRLKGK